MLPPSTPGHKLVTLRPARDTWGLNRQPQAARSLRVRCSAGGPNLQNPVFSGWRSLPHFHANTPAPLLSSALRDQAPPGRLPHDKLLCSTAAASERSLGQALGRGIPAKGSASRERLGILSIIMLRYEHVPHPSPPSTPRTPTFHHRSFREGRHPFPASESESAGERGSAGTKVDK